MEKQNDNTPDAIPIQLPVRYDPKDGNIRNATGIHFLFVFFWLTEPGAARTLGEYIARVLNTYPSLIAERDKYKAALDYIANTLRVLQERAKLEGNNIDGVMANMISNNASHLKETARLALKQEGRGDA